MKLTTRIALGLALLAGLMLGVMTYQLRTVNDLLLINEELSRTNVEAARVSIRLVQEIEGVGEFAAKSLVVGDPEYETQWAAWEASVIEDLARIRELDLGPRERQALRDVEVGWRRYLYEIAPLRLDPAARPVGAELNPLIARIEELTSELRTGAEDVIEANQAEISAQASHSAAAAARAHRIAQVSALGAGVLALLICVFLYLSISGPLRQLTRGTREVAEGRFEHRLPVRGSSELAGLARDFNHMASRLSELDDLKRDFISHVSHELKGPLAAIHETILVLLERIPGPLTDKQAQLLALSRQSATRLSGMISNLLEVSRIESGALLLEPRRVEIGPLLRDVRDELTPLAAERNLEVEIREGPGLGSGSIAADADRMREVVANLLENALKFSPRGEPVLVRADEVLTPPAGLPTRHRGKLRDPPPFLLLSIEDRGPGIPEEHREGVFEKFYQVKRGSRVHGQGVGLGLAICRSVVEAHGGAIWVQEAEGGGARFQVLLPRAPAALIDADEAEAILDPWHPGSGAAPEAPGAVEADGGPEPSGEPQPAERPEPAEELEPASASTARATRTPGSDGSPGRGAGSQDP